MKKLFILLTAALLTAIMMTACAENNNSRPIAAPETEAAQSALGYRQITQDEAQEMMRSESGYIILDVRTPDEYAEGHIPGAICISHDAIPTDDIPALPDKDQLIMVYCRSGRRSKLTAQQLADQGYTNVVEFGGIIDWTGEITTE